MLNVSQYVNLARSAFFGSSVIELKGADEQRLTFRSSVFSLNNAKVTDATLANFREAMSQAYGVCGEHAFDSVLGVKMQLHQRLTARDVIKVVDMVPTAFRLQVQNEFDRLLDTSPLTLGNAELQRTCQDEFRRELDRNMQVLDGKLVGVDVKDLAVGLFKIVTFGKGGMPLADPAADTVFDKLAGKADDEPVGLMGLDVEETQFSENEASVEDRVKSGALGTGMCVNLGKSRPVIFEKLKTQGVEPGFIFHNDWSRADTHSMMRDVYVAPAPAGFDGNVPQSHADFCRLGLRGGRGNPAAQAYAADYLIDLALSNPDELKGSAGQALGRALHEKFPTLAYEDLFTQGGGVPSPEQRQRLREVKTALFVELRAAIMDTKDAPELQEFEAFRHFSERNILKLDYNEGDKPWYSGAGSCGHFRLPERYLVKHCRLRRELNFKTAISASVGAVGEALANDLTRLCGVKAQDLVLTRGKYSDGGTKLMLTSRYAQGYRDLGDGFLKDGRLVPLTDGQGNVLEEPEDIGRYKAVFMLLGDRDTIGSKGGNKGMVGGKFFAIDPGHSLEGTSSEIEIRDDFSIKDTTVVKKVLVHRFLNFSVFDDSTRAEKFKGILTIRDLRDSGRARNLFQSYRAKFPVGERGSTDYELNSAIQGRINEMEAEFNAQMERMLTIFGPQLALYDALAGEAGPATAATALNAIENLEKATSPTRSTSKNGEVTLRHLEVIPKTRIPWGARANGDGTVTFFSRQKLPEAAAAKLGRLLGDDFSCRIMPDGTTQVTVLTDQLQDFFGAIADDKLRTEA